jgi:hypothetical protein
MKKLYPVLMLVIALFSWVRPSFAQGTFTAIRNGNWSTATTWDVNGIPSATCNNCTITINANVTVGLNANVTLTGTSLLIIGTDATSPAALVIGNSGGTSFATGFNIILVSNGIAGSPPGIKLINSHSGINGSAAGTWDGIFTSITVSAMVTFFDKLIGNAPGIFLGLGGGGASPITGTPTVYGQFSPLGPTTLSSSGGPLPIILSDFEAVLNKNEVNLTWVSEVEVNSDHFGIERSADGAHWNSIGSVAAKGFSDIPVNYSFTDESPFSGVNYYRLQMVDRDGKYAYSDVKVVRRFVGGFSVFPNPARDLVNLSLGSDVTSTMTIRLINQNGQLMQEQRLSNAAGTTVTFALASYAQGNYILEIIDGKGNIQTSKFIISRP